MTQDNPDSPPSAPAESTAIPKTPETPTTKPPRKRWVRLARTAGVVGLIGAVLGAAGIGGAEYYTSRPDFCGSCHIMDPYFDSWTQDIHGRKLDVWCVECHYAPGEQHTFMAKFKGLSQATSYFSGRAGGSRPRAHVADASCLTSKCHGDHEFFETTLTIGEERTETRIVGDQTIEVQRRPSVRFVHKKHLEPGARLEETSAAINAITERFRSSLPAERFERVRQAAVSIEPAAEREGRMRAIFQEGGSADQIADGIELMRLEHMRVRLEQLDGLNCAACHTYDASSANHFSVNRQTCFTCHFTNQAFNRDTGSCLSCHEPPVRKIAVHQAATLPGSGAAGASTAIGVAALMDHRDIVERGIDCASCHLDVVQGESVVTARECTHCHDQQSYLADFDTRTTRTVEEYHRVHVAAQHALCTDCHRAVVHELVVPELIEADDNFLHPVLNDCQHCHPKHHQEQVRLLTGTGGIGTARPMPNAMFGSRLNCRACHTQPGTDFKGDQLIEATAATCVACHSSDYDLLFQQWLTEISNYVKEADASLARTEARVAELEKAGQTVPEKVATLLNQARHNIRLVRAGNGIHNKNYALQLLDLAIRGLDEAMIALSDA